MATPMDQDRQYPVREPPRPKPKRVYKTVAVGEGANGGYSVLLDGRPAFTPMRTHLATASRPLAEAIAAEWDAQDPHVDPETMPLTRLLATALDRVAPQREAVIESLLSYVDADAICYRASHPADLVARQNKLWQPIADWLLRDYDIAITSVQGLMPATQPPGVGVGMRRLLEALDDTSLTAFQATAALTSSLALALALVSRRLTAAEVFAAAFLDELYQVEYWGEDDLARDRRQRMAGDIDAIERYLALSA